MEQQHNTTIHTVLWIYYVCKTMPKKLVGFALHSNLSVAAGDESERKLMTKEWGGGGGREMGKHVSSSMTWY